MLFQTTAQADLVMKQPPPSTRPVQFMQSEVEQTSIAAPTVRSQTWLSWDYLNEVRQRRVMAPPSSNPPPLEVPCQEQYQGPKKRSSVNDDGIITKLIFSHGYVVEESGITSRWHMEPRCRTNTCRRCGPQSSSRPAQNASHDMTRSCVYKTSQRKNRV